MNLVKLKVEETTAGRAHFGRAAAGRLTDDGPEFILVAANDADLARVYGRLLIGGLNPEGTRAVAVCAADAVTRVSLTKPLYEQT